VIERRGHAPERVSASQNVTRGNSGRRCRAILITNDMKDAAVSLSDRVLAGPSRSLTPRAKFCTMTSPWGILQIDTDRALPSVLLEAIGRPAVFDSGQAAAMSPAGVISILMTLAPSSTMSRVTVGPARTWLKSSTERPSKIPFTRRDTGAYAGGVLA